MAPLRDVRQSAGHYQECIERLLGEPSRYRDKVLSAVESDRPMGAAYVVPALRKATQLLSLRYATAIPVDQLVDDVRELGVLWIEMFEAVGERWQSRAWDEAVPSLQRNAELAIVAVHSVSWAVALDEREVVEQVLAAHSVQQASLPVVGHLARLLRIDAGVDGKPSHAKLWQPWIDVVEADDAGRQAAFERFVTTYPAGLKAVGRRVPPKDPGYPGQFAFEAAPLAIHFDLDDAAVRDLDDYPADLVDFGRSLR